MNVLSKTSQSFFNQFDFGTDLNNMANKARTGPTHSNSNSEQSFHDIVVLSDQHDGINCTTENTSPKTTTDGNAVSLTNTVFKSKSNHPSKT